MPYLFMEQDDHLEEQQSEGEEGEGQSKEEEEEEEEEEEGEQQQQQQQQEEEEEEVKKMMLQSEILRLYGNFSQMYDFRTNVYETNLLDILNVFLISLTDDQMIYYVCGILLNISTDQRYYDIISLSNLYTLLSPDHIDQSILICKIIYNIKCYNTNLVLDPILNDLLSYLLSLEQDHPLTSSELILKTLLQEKFFFFFLKMESKKKKF